MTNPQGRAQSHGQSPLEQLVALLRATQRLLHEADAVRAANDAIIDYTRRMSKESESEVQHDA
ncbi:MAG: hypothetical protein HQ518_08650 [Rhodopirellula sp.]|nr:hypothetical protein [Rhodopirellula sp.]